MVLHLVVVAASQALVMVVVVMVVMVVVVVVVMVVVLRVVGLVVHVGSGVVHMLAEPTVLVVVLTAHLLTMTPFLQTCIVVVVWGQVPRICRHVLWAQPSFLVGQDLEGAGAGRRPTGRRALEGSQPVVLVEISWWRVVVANHILRLWVVVVVVKYVWEAWVVVLEPSRERRLK